jgi:pimeloyl-ACP methyl ester carboxylesterase
VNDRVHFGGKGMNQWDELQVRVHGEGGPPTLVYLPGLHGDWTLVSSFRVALGDRLRFVEFAYPRTVTWTLEEHARAVLDKLAANDIHEGWILAESFGSVVAWAVLGEATRRARESRAASFRAKGVILAGGFVRYPFSVMVRVARALNRAIPLWLIKALCWIYGRYAVLRHRRAPETLECVAEFVRRRSEEADRKAICYRYELILASDARALLQNAELPVYHIVGGVDPIVPWYPVRQWLRRHCRTYSGWRLIWRADHNVLGTAPRAAAEQVVSWINSALGSVR